MNIEDELNSLKKNFNQLSENPTRWGLSTCSTVVKDFADTVAKDDSSLHKNLLKVATQIQTDMATHLSRSNQAYFSADNSSLPSQFEHYFKQIKGYVEDPDNQEYLKSSIIQPNIT